MSDIYSAGDNLGDSSFVDAAPSNDNGISAGSVFSSGSSVIPGFMSSGALDNSQPGGLALPLNLPIGGVSTGGNNLLADITRLVGGVYAGENQLAATKAYGQVAQAQAVSDAQHQAAVSKEFTYAAIAGVGILALAIMRGK